MLTSLPVSQVAALTIFDSVTSDVTVCRTGHTGDHGYELRLEPDDLDAHRFEGLVTEARQELAEGHPERAASTLERALSLWRGHPLGDLAYAPFAEREAEVEAGADRHAHLRAPRDRHCGPDGDQVGVGATLQDLPTGCELARAVRRSEHRDVVPERSSRRVLTSEWVEGLRWDEFLANIGNMWATEPNYTEEQLQSITTPFLILDGEEEEAIDLNQTKLMALLIPGAELVLMPGTGHFAMFEQPEVFNQIVLDYLAA